MILHDTDIRNIEDIHQIVDCIDNLTYGQIPLELITLLQSLPNDNYHNYIRTLTVPFLFHKFEHNVLKDGNAIDWFKNILSELKEYTNSIMQNNHFELLLNSCFETHQNLNFSTEVKSHTGQHYGNLFKDFDHYSYFNEAKNLLKTRLERNNISIPNLNELKLLDQGCGGGRYTTAWKLLGVKEAIGLDFSEIGLTDAKLRIDSSDIKDVSFIQGSVLDMPFENESFDIVYSNGVLHHTEDWKKGIAEQLRVMKSGGFGWQYLIENPGGIFWDKIEILRAIMKNVDKVFAQNILKSLGIPTNRVFYMLDHVMVPINTRVSCEELEEELQKNGAINIKRLERGTDFDRVEAIYNKVPYAFEKFGIGEHRYIFNKK